MKMVFVVFNVAIEDCVMESLQTLGISNYTKFPRIQGVGAHSDPHLDSHIWPGFNVGLFITIEDSKVEELLSLVRNLKERFARLGLAAYVLNVEEAI
jgi:nitrogen regulatory protein PII